MQILWSLFLVLLLQTSVDLHADQITPVAIKNYTGEAMEPFVSADGRYLFFNTRNDPGFNTNILFAERQGNAYVYRGELPGSVSTELDGTPTMSASGKFCFISIREYRKTLVTVFCGMFDGTRLNNVKSQPALAGAKMGRLTFDVDVSADGNTLIFAEGTFSGDQAPDVADLHWARWSPDGFKRDPASDRMLAKVNTPDLEYAPALSTNGLELYFTRMTGFWIFRSTRIFVARRSATDLPFEEPIELTSLEGFVEAATIAPDGSLIFHKRVNDRFKLWRWKSPG